MKTLALILFCIGGLEVIASILTESIKLFVFGTTIMIIAIAIGPTDPIKPKQLELPEEFQFFKPGDTITIETINNIIVLEFYKGQTNQKNKELLIIK